MKPRIAICIGHSRPVSGHVEGGAVSVGNISEWYYNSGMAPLIAEKLRSAGIDPVVIDRYQGNGYGSAQRWLAGHLASLGVHGAVELHFNSSDNPAANGHEWLFWHSSARSEALAQSLASAVSSAKLGLFSRGTKAKNSADRGAEFLRGTHCPAVISEPFFGSNRSDWEIAKTRQADLASAIAAGIIAWVK